MSIPFGEVFALGEGRSMVGEIAPRRDVDRFSQDTCSYLDRAGFS